MNAFQTGFIKAARELGYTEAEAWVWYKLAEDRIRPNIVRPTVTSITHPRPSLDRPGTKRPGDPFRPSITPPPAIARPPDITPPPPIERPPDIQPTSLSLENTGLLSNNG